MRRGGVPSFLSLLFHRTRVTYCLRRSYYPEARRAPRVVIRVHVNAVGGGGASRIGRAFIRVQRTRAASPSGTARASPRHRGRERPCNCIRSFAVHFTSTSEEGKIKV